MKTRKLQYEEYQLFPKQLKPTEKNKIEYRE